MKFVSPPETAEETAGAWISGDAALIAAAAAAILILAALLSARSRRRGGGGVDIDVDGCGNGGD